MIQRKQTIYLALAFICTVLLIVFPVFTITAEDEGVLYKGSFGAYGMFSEDGESTEIPIYLLYIFLAMLSLIALFLYKNRKRQMLVCRFNLILNILLAVSLTVFYYLGKGILEEELTKKGFDAVGFSVDVGFFLAVATIPFLILAIRGIKHDENLLKSIDRIR
ncbi:DUF4293 domain-containing protein [Paracrocinitomix mangrovi]|uniref:DUF4293 domain-containing protein n=1 Tax=Paracrocinitomix mangrovi TaxID=2862509 RepID=UPI001C8E11B2|nr:DUF4293 domain-containing protein [Paracrocinitomix mangrovi]UKN01247.1 DUF4293 domain-containing protein [Paracrocinitomix mangrovi]